MKKLMLMAVALVTAPCGAHGVSAQDLLKRGPSVAVPTYLPWWPNDAVGVKVKAAIRAKLSHSRITALLPDDAKQGLAARFVINVQSKGLHILNGKVAEWEFTTGRPAEASAISFTYVVKCAPFDQGFIGGSGMMICAEKDAQKCAETIVESAQNNASAINHACGQ